MKLEFDVEKMRTFKDEVAGSEDKLQKLSAEVSKGLEELKQNWHTNAGEKFFKENLGNWKWQVDKYIALLDVLGQMMDTAIEQYSDVEEKAGGTAIRCI